MKIKLIKSSFRRFSRFICVLTNFLTRLSQQQRYICGKLMHLLHQQRRLIHRKSIILIPCLYFITMKQSMSFNFLSRNQGYAFVLFQQQ